MTGESAWLYGMESESLVGRAGLTVCNAFRFAVFALLIYLLVYLVGWQSQVAPVKIGRFDVLLSTAERVEWVVANQRFWKMKCEELLTRYFQHEVRTWAGAIDIYLEKPVQYLTRWLILAV